MTGPIADQTDRVGDKLFSDHTITTKSALFIIKLSIKDLNKA